MRSRTSSVVLVFALLTISCASLTTCPPTKRSKGWLYDSITFEIAPITSAEPSPRALEFFRKRLHENRICHQKQVKIITRRAVNGMPPGVPWMAYTLRSYENLRRSRHDDGADDRRLTVFVAYIDGPWMEGGTFRMLGGIQYAKTSFAIFKSGARGREGAVLLHEFGHLIGLIRSPELPNHDGSHRNHCAVQTCIMYWTAPRGTSPDLDIYCKRQLAAKIRASQVVDED